MEGKASGSSQLDHCTSSSQYSFQTHSLPPARSHLLHHNNALADLCLLIQQYLARKRYATSILSISSPCQKKIIFDGATVPVSRRGERWWQYKTCRSVTTNERNVQQWKKTTLKHSMVTWEKLYELFDILTIEYQEAKVHSGL